MVSLIPNAKFATTEENYAIDEPSGADTVMFEKRLIQCSATEVCR